MTLGDLLNSLIGDAKLAADVRVGVASVDSSNALLVAETAPGAVLDGGEEMVLVDAGAVLAMVRSRRSWARTISGSISHRAMARVATEPDCTAAYVVSYRREEVDGAGSLPVAIAIWRQRSWGSVSAFSRRWSGLMHELFRQSCMTQAPCGIGPRNCS